MFIGTFCPEWIFTVALMEFWDARHQLSRLKTSQSFRGEDEKKVRLRKAWKLSHMFFANMGGKWSTHATSRLSSKRANSILPRLRIDV